VEESPRSAGEIRYSSPHIRALYGRVLGRFIHPAITLEIAEMGETVPRWEWRAFAREIGARIGITSYPLIHHIESSEIYLVTSSSKNNPKIRDAKIDIKALEQRNEHGLEQWKPVLKASFPLSRDQMIAVYRSLDLPAPPDASDSDLQEFLQAVNADARIWAVTVHKVRDQYDVEGCSVEVSEATFDDLVLQTIATEDADPSKVMATVAELGLSGQENINYVTAIQRIKLGSLP